MNPYLAKKIVQAYNHLLKASELLEHVERAAGSDEELKKQTGLLDAEVCITLDRYSAFIERARNASKQGA